VALGPPRRARRDLGRGHRSLELVGETHLAWEEVTAIAEERTLLGRKTLRIRGAGGRIEVAPVLPGYDELERRVFAGQAAAVAA